MSFEHDIFVSYAHVDNKPFDNPRGWVDSFSERLALRLAQLTGSEPDIWRDTRLQGNEYFSGSIGDGISATLLLLSVISPRYVNSDWCRGELTEFSRRTLQTGGASVGNLSRIFKVVKTHVAEEEMPEELRGLLGYHFYDFDERGRPREFRPDDPPNKDQRYWDRLEDLALDIVKALKSRAVERGTKQSSAANEDAGDALPLEKKVYLAETTADVSAERDCIRRELQQRGFYVLPDRELPRRAPDFQASVREHLARCCLSVQLVGATYGLIPEGEEESSIIRLQEELAAERAAADSEFARLIWMPTGLQPVGARHQKFVEQLQTSLGAGAELLQTSVEDLKLRVLEKLTTKPKPEVVSKDEGDAQKSIYLMCDNRDLDDVTPIEDYLFNEGFEIANSAVMGEGEDLAQFHREKIRTCDAALIYYGNANPMWLDLKLTDLQKAPEWGRTRELTARAVYVGAPQSVAKTRFRTHKVPLVIQNFEGFNPDSLRPFVNALRAGNGGQR
jgi:hypothetical protein